VDRYYHENFAVTK